MDIRCVKTLSLRFYWGLGRDISFLSEKAGYGSNFYEMYPDAGGSCQQLVDGSEVKEIGQQSVDELESIFHIPWGHHVQILGKSKGNVEKALFYVKKTIENNWSRAMLLTFMDTDLYERQGKAVTNFSLTLPKDQSDLAQAMTKDPYNFDFLTLREQYNEKEFKDALISKVENFLMELGTGFAYMGREVMVKIGRLKWTRTGRRLDFWCVKIWIRWRRNMHWNLVVSRLACPAMYYPDWFPMNLKEVCQL